VQDGIGIQIVKLNPVGKKKPVEERMRGKGKSSEKKGKEEYPKPRRRSRDNLRVTSQDFIKFWGKFFAFVLHVLIENSQGIKTFEFI
jgi:hypothetical protein